MEASLYIDLPGETYLPGDPLAGKILWALEKPPGRIFLSLGWWTEGRGSQDTSIVAEQEWETPEIAGEEAFSFTLPEQPYSFHGSLISLKWALELSVQHGSAKQIRELVVSPHGVPVELSHVEDESVRKPVSLFRRR